MIRKETSVVGAVKSHTRSEDVVNQELKNAMRKILISILPHFPRLSTNETLARVGEFNGITKPKSLDCQVSRELGVGSNLIARWKKELEQQGVAERFLDDKDAEVRRLQAELRELKEDHDVVIKAAAYLARDK